MSRDNCLIFYQHQLNMVMNSINIIRKIRKSKNLSANAFALRLMISVVYLSMLENDKKKLSRRIAERIIEIFPDLGEEDRLSLENAIYFDVQDTQKYIMSLTADFFSNLEMKEFEKVKANIELIEKAMKKLAKLEDGWAKQLIMFKA